MSLVLLGGVSVRELSAPLAAAYAHGHAGFARVS